MRLYMAGSQDMGMLDLLIKAKAPFILMSHLYMKKKSITARKEVLQKAQDAGCQVLMDAGTFTFNEKGGALRMDAERYEWMPENVAAHRELKASGRYKPMLEEFRKGIRAFFQEYLQDIETIYADKCCAIAELDVDHFVEDEEIWKMRERYPKQVIPKMIATAHRHFYDPKHLQQLIDFGFTYFGVEGVVGEGEANAWFSQNWDMLTKHKIKVHGWAATKEGIVRKVPYFSCDSSTWLGGQRYGTTYVYEGNRRMRVIDFRQKERIRPGLKSRCLELDVDFDKFLADDANEVGLFNAHNWAQYSRDEALDTTKAYWLSEDEKKDLDDQAADQFRTAISLQNYEKRLAANGGARPRGTAIQDFRALSPRFCNTCILGPKCPGFERDQACKFDFELPVQSLNDIHAMARAVVQVQMGRMNHAVFGERVTGTHADRGTTQEVFNTMRVIQMAGQILQPRVSVTVSAEATGEQGVGVLSKLFGGYGKAGDSNPAGRKMEERLLDEKQPEPIDVSTYIPDAQVEREVSQMLAASKLPDAGTDIELYEPKYLGDDD